MNKQQLKIIYKLLSFTLIFFLACGFQASFWPNLITFLPSPQIWLIVLLFIAIKWKSVNNIFFIYFLSYCLTMFTDVPIKMLWCPLAITYFAVVSVKDRIQLAGVLSFILFCFIGSILFETSYFLFSDLLEPTPTTVMFLDRMLQVLMNFVFSYPVYFVLDLIDRSISTQEDWRDTSVRQDQSEHFL